MPITLASTSATQGNDFSTVVSGFTAGTENRRRLANNSQGRYSLVEIDSTTMRLIAKGDRLVPGTDRVTIGEAPLNGQEVLTRFEIVVSPATAATDFNANETLPGIINVGDTVNVAVPTITGGTAPFTYRLLDARSRLTVVPTLGLTFANGTLTGTAQREGLYGVVIEVRDANGRLTYTPAFSITAQYPFFVPGSPGNGGGAIPAGTLTLNGTPVTLNGRLLALIGGALMIGAA